MATRSLIAIVAGQVQQLQLGDGFMHVGPYAPGSLSIAAGTFVLTSKRVTMTGSQRITAVSDARLRCDG
jgi:hypothetical protein